MARYLLPGGLSLLSRLLALGHSFEEPAGPVGVQAGGIQQQLQGALAEEVAVAIGPLVGVAELLVLAAQFIGPGLQRRHVLRRLGGAEFAEEGDGLKPASLGAMPLQPWGNAGATSGAATTPGGVEIPAAYAALGGNGMGAGMGGAPMVPPGVGKDKDGGQVKRVNGDEAALYTENRAWTEGIIGRCRPIKETASAA